MTRGRIGGAARGLGLGVAAGVIWILVEAIASWAAGSVMPARVAWQIAALDLGIAAAAGLVLGGLLPQAPAGVVGLGLAATYGFLRVYSPPGMGAEALYLVAAGASVWAGRRLLGEAAGGLVAALHVVLLGTIALLALEMALDESHTVALRGLRLPLAIAAAPLAAVCLDRLVALVVRRAGVRMGVAAAGGVLWALAFGHPLSTAPIDETVVTAVPPPAGTPDVILVSLDTTRADHLSLYGYHRETTPNLARFAEDAVVYTQGRTTAGWTLPGHASMLTGMYPSRHGAHLAGGWLAGQSIDGRRNVAHPLKADKTTVGEVLRDRGYSTGAFIANFSYLYRDFGLAQGFQHYDDAPGLLLRVKPPAVRFAQKLDPGFCLKPFRTAQDINAAALAWLDRAPTGRPAFLFLNYMEPHQPWLAPAPHDTWLLEVPGWKAMAVKDLYTHEVKTFTPAELDFIVANYDGQVAAMDEAFGQLVAELKARGRYEQALIVVTSDHGELLGDHGQVGHMGRMLHEGLLHVPMVVKWPGADRPRGRRDEPVQVVDVPPTILEAAGARVPAGVQGQHLLRVDRASFAEEDINPFLVAEYGSFYDRAVRVLYDGPWKLVTTSRGERMLFDLARDPAETTDLAATEPERVQRLASSLEERLRTMVVATAAPGRQVN